MSTVNLVNADVGIYFRYKDYTESKNPTNTSASSLDNHFAVGAVFSHHHPKQKKITQAILDKLVVGCALPLNIIERPDFRE